jgi:hypothetical protein
MLNFLRGEHGFHSPARRSIEPVEKFHDMAEAKEIMDFLRRE